MNAVTIFKAIPSFQQYKATKTTDVALESLDDLQVC